MTSDADAINPRTSRHSRARGALFWTTLAIAIGQVILAIIVANGLFAPALGKSPLPLALLPIVALVDVLLDVVCLIVGRRANRILGALALFAVVAQVLFVLWIVNGLSHANFVL